MEMRLDYKKWRDALDRAMANKANADEKIVKDMYGREITYLHAIRAHIKGKLHCHRMRLPWNNLWRWGKMPFEKALDVATNGGSRVVDTNFQDQKLYIGDSWRDFVMPPEQEAKILEVRSKNKKRKGLVSYVWSLFSEQ